VSVAAAVRIVGLQAGLPGLGLSPDENNVVPLAMRLVDRGTLNPDWFLYPSLYISLTAGLIALGRPGIAWPSGIDFASPEAYLVDPTPYVLAGRIVSCVAGIAAVVGMWLLARRIGDTTTAVVAAGLMAIAPIMVTYSHLAVTDMLMVALLVFGLWQLIAATQERSRSNLIVAAVLIGLATSAKYNAGFAVIPVIGVAVWLDRTGRRWRLAVTAGATALGAFLAGTPFALLDPGHFWSDFWRQNRIVADGWLGFENSGPGWWYNLNPVLWDAIGPVALVATAIGVGWAVRRRAVPDWVLLPYAAAFFVYVSTWNAHFDRYLLPIIPVLALYAGEAVRGARDLIGRRSVRVASVVVALGALAIAAPAAVSSIDLLRDYGRTEKREAALPDIARLVPPGELIAVEPLTARLRDAAVGPRLERAGVPGEWYRITRLATPQPGIAPDPNRDVATLRTAGVRWVLMSDDIERRVRAAADRYPSEMRFYRQLEGEARRALVIPASLGPGAVLWELPPTTS
jgi:hypothetical protein